MNASPEMKEYFERLKAEVSRLHEIASEARANGVDYETEVEVKLAENMAERVVGLISVLAPQIVDSGVVARIMELEKEYGSLDWRVALKIAEEVALEKFCAFKDKREAMEIGIRTGFAYVTVGIVSSPLDGIVGVELKKRMDGRGEYVCVNYAGPIRNAGGTAAAVSVIITDYVRKKLGYDVYDAQPDEVKRANAELRDYHERITNLQYFPSEAEVEFLLQHLPVEVNGDPSEKLEVSNYKDLPRVPTNNIRSGYCLMLSSCIPLKAPKLWKQLNNWGAEFGLDWVFLEEFLKIQKKAKAGKKKSSSRQQDLAPDYTYIKDLVAGRPVLGYPLRAGGFRLRYGRSRTSGFSAQAMHPATMAVLNKYVATGTQLKTERPGKAASMTGCDTIDGPIVMLDDGSVMQLRSLEEARRVQQRVREVLFLGDVLVAHGDFFNRAHQLVPAGYCQEWWALEVERALAGQRESGLPEGRVKELLRDPLRVVPSAQEALALSQSLGVSLHPEYTPFWKLLSVEELGELLEWFDKAEVHAAESGVKLVLPRADAKRYLERIGLPHRFVNNEFVVIDGGMAAALSATFRLADQKPSGLKEKMQGMGDALEAVNAVSPVSVRDKAGTFIGTRMGRPEKAKQRLLTGNPHVLFPVGEEGGRLRSFQSALEAGKVSADFPFLFCKGCNAETVLSRCEVCGGRTEHRFKTAKGLVSRAEAENMGGGEASEPKSIPIKHYFDCVLKQLGTRQYPDLIKGVRGTSNEWHIPEHLGKGMLRARYDIHVYKDGTTRYDMTQLPMTHFRPCEIGTEVEQLRALGYVKDIDGNSLEREDQVVELKPQDVVLPNCDEAPEAGAGEVLVNVARFVDDELELLYNGERVYNAPSFRELVGQLVIVLAPHTSAGIVGRIIGFSRTQGLFAHPLLHAATRRDCDGDEACVVLLLDAFLNFSKRYLPGSRGATMDTPLVLTSVLAPAEVDDMAFDVDIGWRYPLELYEAGLQYKTRGT